MEYEGQITVSIVDVNSDEGQAAVKEYGWTEPRHGLVTLRPDGSMVGTLPGHRYGKAEIKAKVDELLAAE